MSLPFDHYMLTLGKRDELTREKAIEAARAIEGVLRQANRPRLDVFVEGYDDDPREVYDIPEVMAFFGDVFRRVTTTCPAGLLLERVSEDSKPIVLLGLGLIRREQIRIGGTA